MNLYTAVLYHLCRAVSNVSVIQVQLVACLQWLGEFQVLACIPLSGSVPTKDVAELAGVPEGTLCRIVRMTATAGFLCEPQSGHVAHTPLSSPFVVKPSYLDAAMFLAETAAPTALRMSAATQRHGSSERPSETAYTVAFNTSQTFQSACEQRLKLQRQWPAFLRCAGDVDDGLAELLGRLDWHSLGNACIVEVSVPVHPENERPANNPRSTLNLPETPPSSQNFTQASTSSFK